MQPLETKHSRLYFPQNIRCLYDPPRNHTFYIRGGIGAGYLNLVFFLIVLFG